MIVRKFKTDDLEKLEQYLREQYLENKNMTSWLPERLHDLFFRLSEQEKDANKPQSIDYIYLYEENNKIIVCILPDGDAIYISIKKGYEDLFESMISFAEQNCVDLFTKDKDGQVEFLIVTNDSLDYRINVLKKLGYIRQLEEDYDNYVYPGNCDVNIKLPKGFKIVYGNDFSDEDYKWSACNLGFHPDLEKPNYRVSMNSYNNRKNSSMYNDSFECLIIDENEVNENNVCSYCFVYVDKKSKTAFIEPVSTREKYRHLGLGTAMMHGVMLKCKEMNVEKCYVNSYDWRRKFYNAAGFITEDTIGYWKRKINK